MLFDTKMIDTDTSGLIRTRQHTDAVSEWPVLRLVRDSWRGEKSAVDSHLPDAVLRGGAEPQVMLAGAIDLRLEADTVACHDQKSSKSLFAT